MALTRRPCERGGQQAKIERGELIWAAERGRLRWEQAHELRNVVTGSAPGRPSKDLGIGERFGE